MAHPFDRHAARRGDVSHINHADLRPDHRLRDWQDLPADDAPMSLITYLAFGLVCAHADAMACFVSKRRYNAVASLVLCLIWPICAAVVIVNVALGKHTGK